MKVKDLKPEDSGKTVVVKKIADKEAEKELKLTGKKGKLDYFGPTEFDSFSNFDIHIKEDGYGRIALDLEDEVELIA